MNKSALQIGLTIVLAGLVLVLIGSILILAGVPPVSRDALTHHLTVPKLYLKHGGIYEIPSLIFSYFPMNLDLLYIIPLYFGNDIIPKYIHFAFALFAAWLIFSYLKKRSDIHYGLAGVLFFLSLPIIVKLSITVYVDLGLVFFSTAALLNVFKWMESSFKFKYLIISSVFCGLALGTKYNGLVVLFLLTFFVAFVCSKKTRYPAALNETAHHRRPFSSPTGNALVYATAYMVIDLVIFSPWAIRNYLWTNNPIYPLYDSWFNTTGTGIDADLHADFPDEVYEATNHSDRFNNPFVMRKVIYKESGWQILTLPIRVFFQGKDDSPKYFDGRLNPYLLLLPFFAFFPRKDGDRNIKSEKNIMLAFSVLFLLIVFSQRDLRIRYIAPIIPPLVILSALGLQNMVQAIRSAKLWPAGRLWAGLAGVGLALLIGMNAVYVWEQFQGIQPISYLSGRLERDAYIETYRPEYAAIQFANRNLPDSAKIFCLFLGDRSYYSDKQMLFGDAYFKRIVKQANSAEQLALELKKRNITHLLIRYEIFYHWSKHQFNNRDQAILGYFWGRHARLIFTKGGYGLYRF
ncbi:MAG: phospholipid carrier-dependent glycosyltransferase [Desulfobacterales bacterium]|nr:MAG: phospholipid carrier-dependent glycosyltransferase [Desulfobacterales bacterium]